MLKHQCVHLKYEMFTYACHTKRVTLPLFVEQITRVVDQTIEVFNARLQIIRDYCVCSLDYAVSSTSL